MKDFKIEYPYKMSDLMWNTSKSIGHLGPVTVTLKSGRHEVTFYDYVRIHVSGDFYSAPYIAKWMEIAKRCPEVLFRTTTRRSDFIDLIYKLDKLPNMSIRESIDPSAPVPKTKLRLASAGVTNARRKQIMCPDDCEDCGHRCWLELDKDEVFLEY